jgi:acyl-CoA thioester hydrolase
LHEHRFPVKVYYEDTDAQGIVYHANYLRFMERGRTEYLEAHGGSLAELDRSGRHLAVHEMHVKFIRPARLGDRLEVVSRATPATPFRVTFVQRIERPGDDRPYCEAEIEVVCLDDEGHPARIPEEVSAHLE